jgi:dipeptidyl aminopeptidase/acylaminoacyl peptidase
MYKISFILGVFLALVSAHAQTTEVKVDEWLHAGPIPVNKPVFADTEDTQGKTFDAVELLKTTFVRPDVLAEAGHSMAVLNHNLTWSTVSVNSDSVLISNTHENEMHLLSAYVQVDRYVKGKLNIHTDALMEVYVNGQLKATKKSKDLIKQEVNLELENGKHQILIKLLSQQESLKYVANAKLDEPYSMDDVEWSLSPDRALKVEDVISGPDISKVSLSPSGKYYLLTLSEKSFTSGKSQTVTYIREVKDHANKSVFRSDAASAYKWLPKSDRISYQTELDEQSQLYVYDVESNQEVCVANGLKDFSSYTWAPTEDKIIYSVKTSSDKPGDLKRIHGADDRIPYFRNRYSLYVLYINSGHTMALTHGRLTTSLHDIHPDGNKVLFSTSDMDYNQPSFRLQCLYELNLNTYVVDTLWKDKVYGGSASYSPSGNQILVTGGPECFGPLGVNVPEGVTPNNYDGQMYLYDLTTRQAKAISKTFAPAVDWVRWIDDNTLYLRATERDFKNLYRYTISTDTYKKMELEVEVLSQMSFAKQAPLAMYTGTSMTTPNGLYLLNLKKERSQKIALDVNKSFDNIQLGSTKEWNFENKNGTTIYGRVYYPPGYNAEKKYPVIVYYYGGTTPVERNFGGRYPKNVWAAQGYIVYVLQPSGAIGFGQAFSALHVNGWGRDAIDDIIEGTKGFLKAHPAADAANVGCIGASYGGYTTMMLQTRTDIFKTAISHAGISSITSYWGEGYWGYTYSSVASAGAFPWNRKDVYVENSPLYNADKFQNSILLLHGTKDTNVPVGESKQFYAALKILGKDVEMVLVDGEDHWVIDHKKRLAWHHTIVSWFDKKLKDQPQHWESMYPEKNY